MNYMPVNVHCVCVQANEVNSLRGKICEKKSWNISRFEKS